MPKTIDHEASNLETLEFELPTRQQKYTEEATLSNTSYFPPGSMSITNRSFFNAPLESLFSPRDEKKLRDW